MGIMDSSFLFLPFGNDLLVIALVARHHDGWPFYVLSAVCGSTVGVWLLDLVARRVGERGVQKIAGRWQFARLKRMIEKKGGIVLIVGCLSPPPFPFTMAVATTSALGYPRTKLLGTVAASRAIRFVILSFLAIKFGRAILHIMNTDAFRWTMVLFIILCLAASAYSAARWLRGRPTRRPAAATT